MKLLYALYATYSTGFNLVWRILPAFLAAFFGAFEISLIFAAFFAARIFMIPIALTADKLGTIRTVRLSFSFMILLILGLLFLFGVKSLSGWIIFALIAGVLVNLLEIAANTLAASVKKKTKALFGLESMYQIGVVIGPIVGGLLTLHFGIEAALFTWAALNIIGILVTPRVAVSIEKRKRLAGGLISAIKERKFAFFMMLVFGLFFVGFLQAMQEITLPLFATTVGFDIANVGIIIGLASIITIAALLTIGKRIDKHSPFSMLFIFYILMLIFPLLVPVFYDFISLIIIGGVFLTGRAANLNISRSFFSEFSDKYKATAIGIGETVYYLSRSVGSAFTGYLVQGFGYGFAFDAMVFISGIALLGSSIVLIIYSRKSKYQKI